MAKRLIDVDEAALSAARAALGTTTMKDTVNEALRRAGAGHLDQIRDALDHLATVDVLDRREAWR